MASSSSSSKPREGSTYDVFLSFRGEDTRYSFLDHLYAALVRYGLSVFKDDLIIQGGDKISPKLLEAIKGSMCAVVVLSKNYANSSWCLTELAKIMECHDHQKGQLVIPVFYHVDPSDVRKQKGDYDIAFRQHEKSSKETDELNGWRRALTAISHLSGHHISDTIKEEGMRGTIVDERGESTTINKIVQQILDITRPRSMDKNLIGIESRIEKVISLLKMEATQEVRMVGIHGMGGIGKTTLAHALFRRISHDFEGSSFVKDVREKSSSGGVSALQEKILKDILGRHHNCEIEDPEDGAAMIQTRFCNKKVLLVIDDVDHANQLEFLAGTRAWFGAGSRIIITTRDEHLLSDTNAKYKAEFLLYEQAIELFSRHAFRKNSPPDGYEELSDCAISYTGRLPLALKVLGSFLRERQADEWRSALDRLAIEPDGEILKTLKISFNGLKKSEQQIFLDIACFFKGEEQKHVTRILDSFGFHPKIGVRALIDKSLISVSNYGRLVMHDLLQEMGLDIVRESYPGSRLCERIKYSIQNKRVLFMNLRTAKRTTLNNTTLFGPNMARDMLSAVLTCAMKFEFATEHSSIFELKAIEAIVDPYSYDEPMGLSAFDSKNMVKLRLLDIGGKSTFCEPPFLPDELRWIRWRAYPFSSLGVPNKLVGLEILFGQFENFRMGQKVMPYLKFIKLDFLDCLERFPDVSGSLNLESLELYCCRNLVEVHGSLGSHRKIVHLRMTRCSKLKYLPHRFEMESLKTLVVSHCHSLEMFPEVSSCMSIPNSICELKSLKILNLQDCNQLRKFPKDLGSLEKLVELSLGFSKHLEVNWISESINFHTFRNLCCLRVLDLSGRQIEDIDFFNNLDTFSSLEELYLCGNSKLVQLPTSISHLSCLKLLDLNECKQLQNIQGLPSGIQVLKARNCEALEKIEDLTEECLWLYQIWLVGCNKLLRNQENERYLEKMLQMSLFMKCVDLDRRLNIHIPGSKIPSWFKEQQEGKKITLKLSPVCRTSVMGFAVCIMFNHERNQKSYGETMINFIWERSGKLLPKLKVDCTNESAATMNGRVWILYIPVSFVEKMHDNFEQTDWSHLVGGSLQIDIRGEREIDRCGAYIVYKEDIESVQQINTCISYHRNLETFTMATRCSPLGSDNLHGRAVTFYFSNFLDKETKTSMWKKFESQGDIVDLYIARKINGWGKRLGLFDLSKFWILERKLNGIWIGSHKSLGNLAKYRRKWLSRPKNYVLDSKEVKHNPKASRSRELIQEESNSRLSYADVVKGKGEAGMNPCQVGKEAKKVVLAPKKEALA
ncbi:LOW QUALITY PROTEIN: hypothetical protein OSB04_029036 [Centaurea solstitialis]|uniref:ADP-ribosyl cyclase/cyclic ADP-ribose hydrolase n=1 Tax=Centaurea solstitialis TaxID=347529 RepID=A0AA38SUE5_9ASTR|nr:LOW QUALITY PROTEIN: hypothetical protein OSB04_029036 [Centaurea solstitialis]